MDPQRRARSTSALALAQQHIAEGEVHIAKQLKLIANLERDGHSTDAARELLETLQKTKRTHKEHCAYILTQLDEATG